MTPSNLGPDERPSDPSGAIGTAIQKMMAARLGRSFIPLGLLLLHATVVWIMGVGDGLWIAAGALATGGSMLAYGLRAVQHSLGRPSRAWMSIALWGSLVPLLFAGYLVAWAGLRAMTVAQAPEAIVTAILNVGFGVWVLRRWMGVVEVERLAQVMTLNSDVEGGPA